MKRGADVFDLISSKRDGASFFTTGLLELGVLVTGRLAAVSGVEAQPLRAKSRAE
nr:hypothetical protein [Psychrobacter sp. PraFG1]UNK06390.1 hypothetical protein MN210_07685 [Psychrobacter sp. PraFG1]